MKAAMIIFLSLIIMFLADRVVRLENQRYALATGVCKIDPANPAQGWKCLDRVQTRTTWFWHLYYAIIRPMPLVPFRGSATSRS